jgi:hypothetical protein
MIILTPWTMSTLIRNVFGIDDWYGNVFINLEEEMIANVDVYEVKEKLGIINKDTIYE